MAKFGIRLNALKNPLKATKSPIVENVIKILRKMITLNAKQSNEENNSYYIRLFKKCLDSYNKLRKQNSGQFSPIQLISLDKSPFYPWSVSDKHHGFSPEKTDIQEINQKLQIAKSNYPIGTIVKVHRIKGLVQKKSRQSFWSEKNFIVRGNLFKLPFQCFLA